MKPNYKIVKDEANKRIIAIGKFGKQSVRGIAKCSPADNYDEEIGIKLACARCRAKITAKRAAAADDRYLDSVVDMALIGAKVQKLKAKAKQCIEEADMAAKELTELERSL